MRLTASQLPPEQHIGFGGTDHGKTHVRFTHNNTEEDDDVQTVITQMAALTTQSQLTATKMAEQHR
jgi:hypothetical protein